MPSNKFSASCVKETTPRQLTDQQFDQRKVKVFNEAAEKFGKGKSKFTPEEIKMTPDQMSKKISQLKDGFLKRWSGKLNNSIYLKDKWRGRRSRMVNQGGAKV